MNSNWIQLKYTTFKGDKKNRAPAASISKLLGSSWAVSGGFTMTFSKPNLETPVALDLLFVAPKKTDDVEYMSVQFLDYPKVEVIPK